MEAINIPQDNVPAELKLPIEQTLKRANELKKVDPVIAYWCTFWAAQKALKVPSRSREGTGFLMNVLDALEEMKAVLADNEAITNEAVGSAYVENFALKVFLGADNADRAGDFGKGTIRKFVVAGQFIDVLNAFETGMSEDMVQKAKYAKWKAADLSKCLREGRTPVAGPPGGETDAADDLFPSLGGVSAPGSERRGSGGSSAPPSGSAGGGDSVYSRRDSSSSLPAALPPKSPPARARSPLVPPTDEENGRWSSLATPGLDPASPSASLPVLPGVPMPTLPGVPLDRATSGTTTHSGGGGDGLASPPTAPALPDRDRTLSRGSAMSVDSARIGLPAPSLPPGIVLNPGVILPPSVVLPSAPSDDERPASPPPRSSESRVFIDLLDSTPSSPPKPTSEPASPPKASAPPLSSAPPPSAPPATSPTTSPARAKSIVLPDGTRLPPGVVLPDFELEEEPDPAPRSAASGMFIDRLMGSPPKPVPVARSAPPPAPASVVPRSVPAPTPSAPAPPAPPASAPPGPVRELTRQETERVQKHCRWAISALEFEDPETARAELLKALAMLS